MLCRFACRTLAVTRLPMSVSENSLPLRLLSGVITEKKPGGEIKIAYVEWWRVTTSLRAKNVPQWQQYAIGQNWTNCHKRSASDTEERLCNHFCLQQVQEIY